MKPGGKVYVAVPNAKSLNRRLGFELGLIDDIYSLNTNDIALGHKRQYCRATLREELNRSGYRVTHEEGIYLKPLPLNVLKTLPNFRGNLEAMCNVGIEFPDLCGWIADGGLTRMKVAAIICGKLHAGAGNCQSVA